LRFPALHSWRLSYPGARALQVELRSRVRARRIPGPVRLVAGADVSYSRKLDRAFGAVCVFRLPDLEPVETATVSQRAEFPYVPGLLSFREAPPLLAAFRRLRARPDAVILDGHGHAHPRFFGVATHVGLWLGLPTVGCAKKRLVGEESLPGNDRGDRAPLRYRGRVVGAVLRTRPGVKPVYVSRGYLSDLETSVRLVLRCVKEYRLPEPVRTADRIVGAMRREAERSRSVP
jgi:deoxyribonuclease V